MIILMVRMMADGPIILDPSPIKELAGKYIFLRLNLKKYLQGWAGKGAIPSSPWPPKKHVDAFEWKRCG